MNGFPSTRLMAHSIRLAVLLAAGLFPLAGARAAELPARDESMRKEALHSIRLGVQWLEKNQNPEGWWSNPMYPAMTALAASAIMNSPDVIREGKTPESVRRALRFIKSCTRPDGGIYKDVQGVKGGGLPNYNTAICLLALADANDPLDRDIILKGRKFIIRSQNLDRGPYFGGMGYDANNARPYSDLSNTVWALEALRRTQPAELGQDKDLNWSAAIDFVSRCQHLRQTNKADWVQDTPAERGGFIYNPTKSQAGEAKSDDDNTTFPRSYASMTYAGLLSFIYAQVDRQDPRVLAACDWIKRHWSVDENPGVGAQGLYYHYLTMSKALDVNGQEELALATGQTVGWRSELVKKLVSLQKIDPPTGLGFWQNENNRWWENDPSLVTAYTLLALDRALMSLPKK